MDKFFNDYNILVCPSTFNTIQVLICTHFIWVKLMKNTMREYVNEYLLNCNLPAEIYKNYQVQRLESESSPGGLSEILSSTNGAAY